MRERFKMKSKRYICMAAAAIMIAAAAVPVHAAAEVSVAEADVTADAAILYLSGAAAGQEAEVQIGTETVGTVKLQSLDDTIPMVTWLLVDNSQSIPKADREMAEKLAADIVAAKLPNERINLCTISEHLNVIAKESQDYTNLRTKISQITYEDQETYLTDVLDELLNEEAARQECAYVRCIVISDGVDNNPQGITRDELVRRLAEKNIPIYTFGCQGADRALKEMYALSRQTGARNWAMSDVTDTLEVARILSADEVPVYAKIALPEELRDGTAKGIRLTFTDGAAAETQVTMPFASAPEPEPVPVPAPQPDSASELPMTLLIGIGAAVLVAIGVVVFVLLQKKAEKNRVKSITDIEQGGGSGEDRTEIVGSREGGGDTMYLVGNDKKAMLCLTDVNRSEQYFEVPLRQKVTVGRSLSNQVVLDYDKSVSGTHCEIQANGNQLTVRDLGSSNGTYVDGIRVVDTADIASGSTLKLGRVVLKVEVR